MSALPLECPGHVLTCPQNTISELCDTIPTLRLPLNRASGSRAGAEVTAALSVGCTRDTPVTLAHPTRIYRYVSRAPPVLSLLV